MSLDNDGDVVSVGTTPTLIAHHQPMRRILFVVNESTTVDVRLGSSKVTNGGRGRGILLRAGASIALDKFTGELFGICGSSADVSFMEVYRDGYADVPESPVPPTGPARWFGA